MALLAPLGPVMARPMFGGYGLYLDGIIFALVTSWDGLYFRTDGETKARFAEAGGEIFSYAMRGRAVELPYCTAPPPANSVASVMPWAELGLAAAKRVAKAKRKKP